MSFPLAATPERCPSASRGVPPPVPEATALSGELQARGRFPSLPAALNCAVREQVDRRAGNHAYAGGLHVAADQRSASLAAAKPDAAQPCGVDAAGAGGSSRAAVAVPRVRTDRELHRNDEIGQP